MNLQKVVIGLLVAMTCYFARPKDSQFPALRDTEMLVHDSIKMLETGEDTDIIGRALAGEFWDDSPRPGANSTQPSAADLNAEAEKQLAE